MTKNKTAAKKTEDQSVVYKVPAAFVLMIVVIYAFWKLEIGRASCRERV